MNKSTNIKLNLGDTKSKAYKNKQVNVLFNNLARMRKSSSLNRKQNPIAKKKGSKF